MNQKELTKIAIRTGKFMLLCGAETYRVEDTVTRICATYGMKVDVFCIPTGIFISYESEEGETKTLLKRVSRTSINLQAIADGNQFSREFSKGEMSFEQACLSLDEMEKKKYYSSSTIILGGCIGGGFFTLMFGADMREFLFSFLFSGITSLYLVSVNQNFFTKHFIGGMIAASLSILTATFFPFVSLDMIIIGPIMTLVPGVPLTVGLRDLISGELIAGSAKMSEAIFIAVAIAFGVGFALQIYFILV